MTLIINPSVDSSLISSLFIKKLSKIYRWEFKNFNYVLQSLVFEFRSLVVGMSFKFRDFAGNLSWLLWNLFKRSFSDWFISLNHWKFSFLSNNLLCNFLSDNFEALRMQLLIFSYKGDFVIQKSDFNFFKLILVLISLFSI